MTYSASSTTTMLFRHLEIQLICCCMRYPRYKCTRSMYWSLCLAPKTKRGQYIGLNMYYIAVDSALFDTNTSFRSTYNLHNLHIQYNLHFQKKGNGSVKFRDDAFSAILKYKCIKCNMLSECVQSQYNCWHSDINQSLCRITDTFVIHYFSY